MAIPAICSPWHGRAPARPASWWSSLNRVLLPVVGLLLLAPLSTAQPTALVAQATGGPQGAAIGWTAPSGGSIDGFVIERSHAGSAFTPIASVSANVFAYLDADGRVNDVYIVVAFAAGVAAGASNPAPAVPYPDGMCPILNFTPDFPYVWVNEGCIPLLPP